MVISVLFNVNSVHCAIQGVSIKITCEYFLNNANCKYIISYRYLYHSIKY